MEKYDVQILHWLRGTNGAIECAAMNYETGVYKGFVVSKLQNGLYNAQFSDCSRSVQGNSVESVVTQLVGATNVTKDGGLKACMPEQCKGWMNELIKLVRFGKYVPEGRTQLSGYVILENTTIISPVRYFRLDIDAKQANRRNLWFGYHWLAGGSMLMHVMYGSSNAAFARIANGGWLPGYGMSGVPLPYKTLQELT